MEMIGLKSSLRIDRFDRCREAVGVIREGCGDMEAQLFDFLQKLLGLLSIFRRRFMGHEDPVMLILDHHYTIVRAPRVVAINMTLRRRGDREESLKYFLLGGQVRPNFVNPSLDRRLGDRKQEQRGKDQSNVPQTDTTHHREIAGQANTAVAHMLRGRDTLDLRGEVRPLVIAIEIVTLS